MKTKYAIVSVLTFVLIVFLTACSGNKKETAESHEVMTRQNKPKLQLLQLQTK